MLGPIDLTAYTEIGPLSYLKRHNIQNDELTNRIDWVIVGGESGHKARPMNPEWATSMRLQCMVAGVPFFFKQWGEWSSPGFKQEGHRGEHFWPLENGRGPISYRVGKKQAGRFLDGREYNEFPRAAER